MTSSAVRDARRRPVSASTRRRRSSSTARSWTADRARGLRQGVRHRSSRAERGYVLRRSRDLPALIVAVARWRAAPARCRRSASCQRAPRRRAASPAARATAGHAGASIPSPSSPATDVGRREVIAEPVHRRHHAAGRAARDGARAQGRARHHRAVRLDDLPLLPPVPARDLPGAQARVHRHRQGALHPAASSRSASSRALPPSRCAAPRRTSISRSTKAHGASRRPGSARRCGPTRSSRSPRRWG